MDLRMLRFAIPAADLFMRSRASPSGTETNITARITGTGTKTAANYDIKDVSASRTAPPSCLPCVGRSRPTCSSAMRPPGGSGST